MSGTLFNLCLRLGYHFHAEMAIMKIKQILQKTLPKQQLLEFMSLEIGICKISRQLDENMLLFLHCICTLQLNWEMGKVESKLCRQQP